VNIYTSFYATCNARSLMHFLSLRTKRDNARFPSGPQLEIQMVADQMENHLRDLMPYTAAAFDKHGRVAP
jgi:thymidylate synthase (FAD)